MITIFNIDKKITTVSSLDNAMRIKLWKMLV